MVVLTGGVCFVRMEGTRAVDTSACSGKFQSTTFGYEEEVRHELVSKSALV